MSCRAATSTGIGVDMSIWYWTNTSIFGGINNYIGEVCYVSTNSAVGACLNFTIKMNHLINDKLILRLHTVECFITSVLVLTNTFNSSTCYL